MRIFESVALRGLDETVVAFADEIGQGEPLALVLLRHRDDETEVSADHLVEGLLVALLDALGELDLLIGSEQLYLADFIQVLVQHPLLPGNVHTRCVD